MRKRTRIMALVGLMSVGAFVVFMGIGGFAVEDSGSIGVSAGIAPTIQLTMGPDIDFGPALAPGTSYSGSTTATVNSNKTWLMSVEKDGDLTQGAFTIPSENLTYGSDNGGDTRIKNTQASGATFELDPGSNVANGCDRGAVEAVNINYSLTVPWDVEAGTYTATHTYTANND
jgi:hypothetical protein